METVFFVLLLMLLLSPQPGTSLPPTLCNPVTKGIQPECFQASTETLSKKKKLHMIQTPAVPQLAVAVIVCFLMQSLIINLALHIM